MHGHGIKPMTGRQGGGRGSWKGGVLTVRVWALCDFMMKQVMPSVGLLKVSIPGTLITFNTLYSGNNFVYSKKNPIVEIDWSFDSNTLYVL